MNTSNECRIEIEQPIDSGLYGRVYRGRQIDLNRVVAVKIIKPEWTGAADAIEHAKAIARVGLHPNIVTVYGVELVTIANVGSELPAMIMEWLEGEKFGVRLAGPHFSEQEARRICAGVLDGVEHLHTNGVAHGDLHYGNVILLSNCTPKIIDVDANKDHSLARLSTVSREAAVQADIDHCRHIVYKTCSHTNMSMARLTELDNELQSVETIEGIRVIVDRAFDEQRPSNHASGSALVSRYETAQSLMEKVQQFIEDDKPASLHSLIMGQLRLLCNELKSERFSINEEANHETIQKRVEQYHETLGPILTALAVGCFWGGDEHIKLWSDCIETVANLHVGELANGTKVWYDLRRYPPLTMLYAAGLGAFLNDRFGTLKMLLRGIECNDQGTKWNLATELFHWKAENCDLWNNYVLDKKKLFVPISEDLERITFDVMGNLTLLQSRFESQFDHFEYFIGLVECYGDGNRVPIPGQVWGPIGTFIWRCKPREGYPGQRILRDASERGAEWAPFKANFFGGQFDHLERSVAAYDEFLQRVRGQLHIW